MEEKKEDVDVRRKNINDNSVFALALIKFSKQEKELVKKVLSYFYNKLQSYGPFRANYVVALDEYLNNKKIS